METSQFMMMPICDGESTTLKADFENLVTCYYRALYQFALALTRSEADASDLTQQTLCVWAIKGNQLRDGTKVKSWLFTTLHRGFLQSRRKENRYPHCELSQVETELPGVSPPSEYGLDSSALLRALAQVDPAHQAPVALFYLENCSYREIARILNVPIGTVKSRISRGLALLHKLLAPEALAGRNEAKTEPPQCAPGEFRAASMGRKARRYPQARYNSSASTKRAMPNPGGARNTWEVTIPTMMGAIRARASGTSY